MSPKPKEVPEARREDGLGSLRGCLVEGNAEQNIQERKIRRRALAISVVLQSAVLAALILVPLFSRAERISLTIVTPLPPYSRYRSTSHSAAPQPPRPHGQQNTCRFCAPPNIPPTIVTHDRTSSTDDANETPIEGIGQSIPGGGEGLIPLADANASGPRRENIETHAETPRILHMTKIDPAMLISRVEPVYPILAKQTHREGRVELRAIIGTDGTIQSLQVVSGDSLFLLSAREAVQQWRYKPTYLNGRAVEIDTYITVVYTMQH
jgi:protein TonB